MKNLANCTPREFLVQTNKIRKAASTWLTQTQILEIRKNQPVLTDDMSAEERDKAIHDQIRKNLSDMLDAMLDEYPNETAELLGLLCFIEPSKLDKYKMTDLLSSVSEILNSAEVISFFTSLMRLAQIDTSAIAKA